MDVDQVIKGLPFIVAENLGLTNTTFPGSTSKPGIQVTAGKAQWKPAPLGGFIGQNRMPQVTPPTEKYVPPLVQQYSYKTYTNVNGYENGYGVDHSNGDENGHSNGDGNGYSNGDGNGYSNGGGSSSGSNYPQLNPEVDYNAMSKQLLAIGAAAAGLVFEGGKAVFKIALGGSVGP